MLSASRIGACLKIRGVRDAIVVRNSSGRAQAVRLLTARGWKRVAAQRLRTAFKLGSTDFELRALTLEPPAARVLFGTHTRVHGWVRGLGKARLQRLGERGWQTVAPIHPGRTVTSPCRCVRFARRSSGSPTTGSPAMRYR